MNSLNRVIGYFDLLKSYRRTPPVGRAGGVPQPSNWWIAWNDKAMCCFIENAFRELSSVCGFAISLH
jgi:hypothetical protein